MITILNRDDFLRLVTENKTTTTKHTQLQKALEKSITAKKEVKIDSILHEGLPFIFK